MRIFGFKAFSFCKALGLVIEFILYRWDSLGSKVMGVISSLFFANFCLGSVFFFFFFERMFGEC